MWSHSDQLALNNKPNKNKTKVCQRKQQMNQTMEHGQD